MLYRGPTLSNERLTKWWTEVDLSAKPPPGRLWVYCRVSFRGEYVAVFPTRKEPVALQRRDTEVLDVQRRLASLRGQDAIFPLVGTGRDLLDPQLISRMSL